MTHRERTEKKLRAKLLIYNVPHHRHTNHIQYISICSNSMPSFHVFASIFFFFCRFPFRHRCRVNSIREQKTIETATQRPSISCSFSVILFATEFQSTWELLIPLADSIYTSLILPLNQVLNVCCS